MMGLRRLALAAVVTVAAGCGDSEPPEAADATWSVWLLRHAEKADDGTRDPPLDATGAARAAGLATQYAQAGIEALWSTDYRRTRDTLLPLAETTGVPVQTYDPREPAALVATLRARARNAMVVGHSNTIPDLTTRLCECTVEPMDDGEYGRMARVRFGPDGPSLETWFEGADTAGDAREERPNP